MSSIAAKSNVFATFFHISWYFEGIFISSIILLLIVGGFVLFGFIVKKLVDFVKSDKVDLSFWKYLDLNAHLENLTKKFGKSK